MELGMRKEGDMRCIFLFYTSSVLIAHIIFPFKNKMFLKYEVWKGRISVHVSAWLALKFSKHYFIETDFQEAFKALFYYYY